VFERYTEKARRVIFFARYEASQYGSPYIETEHLLLGLMREDKALANRFLRQQGSIESIRKEIEARITIRERISTSVEVPLSAECKRILNMRPPRKRSAWAISMSAPNTCYWGFCGKKSVLARRF
jgi:ATP-dependent Clp protease ATP-binding subunit ClpC